MKFTAIFVMFLIVCNVFVSAKKSFKTRNSDCVKQSDLDKLLESQIAASRQAGHEQGFSKGKTEGYEEADKACKEQLKKRSGF